MCPRQTPKHVCTPGLGFGSLVRKLLMKDRQTNVREYELSGKVGYQKAEDVNLLLCTLSYGLP